jgi:hypothetical protein
MPPPLSMPQEMSTMEHPYRFFGEGRPSLQDRIDIEDVISAVSFFVDQHEFDKLDDLFTPGAVMDYSDLFGPSHKALPAAAFLEQVRNFIPGFDATQHLVGNFDIRTFGDRAEARCYVQSSHRIDTRAWVRRSMYFCTLQRSRIGWKISLMGVKSLFEDGDRGLIKEAAERLAARSGKKV